MSERICPNCDGPLPPEKGPGRRRKWCSERCRKAQYAGECENCGGLTDGAASGIDRIPRLCVDCARTQNAEENEEIRQRWNEGEPEWYIAEEMGLDGVQVRSRIQGMRQRGETVELHRERNRTLWPEIQRLWNQGLSGYVIADRLGKSPHGIWEQVKTMRAAGISLTEHATGRRKLTPDQVREIRSTNGTCDEAAAKYGVCRSTISAVRRRKVYAGVA